ncbi:hypothetical protein MKU92_000013 [Salmonella enterica]|nr:hypothetical protein [Salmonella enterica]EKS4617651.1 hypothetical protein [Salmonella enterica]
MAKVTIITANFPCCSADVNQYGLSYKTRLFQLFSDTIPVSEITELEEVTTYGGGMSISGAASGYILAGSLGALAGGTLGAQKKTVFRMVTRDGKVLIGKTDSSTYLSLLIEKQSFDEPDRRRHRRKRYYGVRTILRR